MLFGREFSRKQVCVAGAGILCAALLIGGGAYAISHASWTGDSNAPAVSQSKDDEKQDMVLTLEVKADGWDADTSTPIIAHIEDADGEVDFYTAIAANKQVTVEIGESGTYSVTLIPPVNADGSTYKAASSKVKAGKDDKKTNGTVITLEKVDAGKLTKDDLTAIAKDVAAAVKKGDSTLTGDKGAAVAKKFEDNIKKNPNADADAVEKESEKAQETAKEDKSDAKTPETSDNKKNDSGSKNDSGNNGSGNKSDSKPSGGSGNSSSGSSSGGSSKKDDTTAHQHNWVAQTKTVHHDAQYKTVHHDAVTHQVWHDPVTEEHYICNQCGADITSDPWGHINNSLMNGGNCGSYHSIYVTVKQGYSETVTDEAAWDEQVLVSKAWDETVTTGYKCSSCGATK
ncbi:hypothetical protein [Collinsella aerofaciens]|uniref:Uncharacterized protein n=1 Tax=Collinsella aerofaciens TaxID=74426 RepID=A0A174IB65_9ACTN|nr:hypothetical protein [Collinsella aerofaciens]CUO83691.1 Uncharacterised protein [Collinsella aerofaciens]